MLAAGALKHVVSILAPPTGRDGAGQPTGDWTQVHTGIAANVRHQTGAEANRADAPVSVVKASIRVRYRTTITAGMRVQHRTALYEIQAVLPDEVGRQHVDLACELVT